MNSTANEPDSHSPAPRRRALWYRQWGKRTFDLIAASLLLLVLAPVMLVTAVLVAIRMGRPVLFQQLRGGKHGAVFSVLKFRTMTNEKDANGDLLPDAERLPPLGRWLRTLSLDELPQLINVIRGEMSLVGPRPLIARYIPRYTPEQFRRLEVSPGVTGQAQLNGRNALTWEQKFEHDVWYVDNISITVDLFILVKTVFKTLIPSGVSSDGHATAPEFWGTESPPTASSQIESTDDHMAA